jgi:hypothetical protein
MDLINKVDNGINSLLSNHIIYTILIVILIIAIVFPEKYDVIIIRSGLINILDSPIFLFIFILLIAYLLNKDVRLGILLSILILIILEKYKINEINNRLVNLIVNDIKNDERLNRLEAKYSSTSA